MAPPPPGGGPSSQASSSLKKAGQILTHPLNPAKQFSTGQQLMWEIKMSEIIRMNGPKLPKKKARTDIIKPSQSVKDTALPLALKFHQTRQLTWPSGFNLENFLEHTRPEWEDSAGGKMKASPTEMSTEQDVITQTVGTWGGAIENFLPEVLKYLQIPGKVAFPGQLTVSDKQGNPTKLSALFGASRPDFVVTYNGYPVAALDYKGPNCINFSHELELCGASSEEEAKQAISDMPMKVSEEERKSLMRHKKVSQTGRYLIQSMARYAMDPNSVDKDGDYFPDAYICEEKDKSTKGNFVWSEDSHVNVTLRFLLDAIEAHRRKHGENVLEGGPESKLHQATEGLEKSFQKKLGIK
ncbi:MAG: hypothetical protein Q9159_002069 [Coniocarpon cinnabarinum]